MIEKGNGTNRAANEGMAEAIGQEAQLQPAEKHLLKNPEILDQIFEEFWHTESVTTVSDAARSLAENIKASALMKSLANDTDRKLRGYLREHVGEEKWAEIEEAELNRQLFIDKTITSGTPG